MVINGIMDFINGVISVTDWYYLGPKICRDLPELSEVKA